MIKNSFAVFLLILGVALLSCSDQPTVNPPTNILKNSPLGDLPFNDWEDIDNVLRLSSGQSVGINIGSTNSVANAWFFDRANYYEFIPVSDVSVDGVSLPNASTTKPNYYNPDDFSYRAPETSVRWDVRINSNTYTMYQQIPAFPPINISPMSNLNKSAGLTVTWTPQLGLDSVIARISYNQSMTEYYDSTATLYGRRKDAVITEDDDGSIIFSPSSLSDLPPSGKAELIVTWFKFDISTVITGKNTLLVSSFSYSIPLEIRN